MEGKRGGPGKRGARRQEGKAKQASKQEITEVTEIKATKQNAGAAGVALDTADGGGEPQAREACACGSATALRRPLGPPDSLTVREVRAGAEVRLAGRPAGGAVRLRKKEK